MRRTFRYVPLAKVASGGTATVYVGARGRGRTATRDLVALKRPHVHIVEDPRQRAEVLREANVAASLHHPNVVAVREVEVQGDEIQLVMDYVEGAALGTLIALEAKRDACLPAPIALRVVLDACHGLAAVHAQADEYGRLLGLVHRDVSPQNILVGVDGRARLTDFGLAKAMYTAAPSTTQGTLKGKLGYMAPEYVHHGQVDRAVDVFAMGVVLWEVLAGLRLFRGDNEAQTLDRVLREDPPRLAGGAEYLQALDWVIAGATQKDPGQRFESAAELAARLTDVVARGGLEATAEEVADYVQAAVGSELRERRSRVEAARRGRRRPLWLGGLATLAAAALVTALALRGRAPRGGEATSNPGAATTRSTTATPSVAAPQTTNPPAPAAAPPAPTLASTPAATPAGAPRPKPTRATPASALPPNPYERVTR